MKILLFNYFNLQRLSNKSHALKFNFHGFKSNKMTCEYFRNITKDNQPFSLSNNFQHTKTYFTNYLTLLSNN